ncbi:hypothetical protein NECAME_16409 [Necator americanus]|uniref:Uncharacterized protein n=1 Tax=Necator americanus TaxID=51031 RepID=W2TZ71_NECAM|nr:hypothetical protein NECAME_16409 [Necator americanus]ETN86327.1 hypothetical protein NECAME_16409 [Necator americanus]
MTICTYNARTLASQAAIEDLVMQAEKIKYDVIGLTEKSDVYPLNTVYETGEELFMGTCDSRGVGEMASSSARVWQRTSTLSNNSRPESDVCG